ncbi:MAG TPA: hypothetical protein VGY54_12710 [Polyangiaceae bacterium]|jgi:hypothetical protein|nr:hypothetical protein [Polyangiaceae bacterium]
MRDRSAGGGSADGPPAGGSGSGSQQGSLAQTWPGAIGASGQGTLSTNPCVAGMASGVAAGIAVDALRPRRELERENALAPVEINWSGFEPSHALER